MHLRNFFSTWLPLSLSLLLTGIIGFLVGSIITARSFPATSLQIVPDPTPPHFEYLTEEEVERLTKPVAIDAPPGAAFVASKRGSKYYRLDDPAAAKLKAENRIFFATEAEASLRYQRGW